MKALSTRAGQRKWSFVSAAAAIASALAAAGTARTARASLIITPTFDASVDSQAQNAFNYAAQQIESLFPTPARTVNIQINVTTMSGGLGQSSTNLVSSSYSAMRNALLAANPADSSDVPATDPVSGTHTWFVSTAEAKALGLSANDSSSSDGTFSYNNTVNYTYDPSHRAVSGDYDFIGVAEHEISEIMGRIGGLGADFGNRTPDYVPYDLFRYTAANTRGISNNGAGVYFSMNNGTTDLKNYNNAATNGGDPQDWASGANDAFNAFASPGTEEDITSVDQTAMNALGYSSVPEPASAAILLGGATLLLWRRRRCGPAIPG